MTSRLTLRDFALAFALIGICAFFAVRSPQFLSARNLSLLVTELAITATLAMGMLLVILPGHIDLSAGSGVGLIGGIAAVLAAGGGVSGQVIGAMRSQLTRWVGPAAAGWLPMPPWPPGVAMLVALAIALLLWSLMGALIVRQRIPAFIITLGGLLFFKGLFWRVIQSHTIPFSPPGGAGVTSIWLHLGSWQVRVWEIVREAGGGIHISLDAAGHRFPLLTGTGNLYAMLTTSYIAPLAGHVLAAGVVLLLVLGAWRGRRQRRAFDMPVEAGEIAFLRLFIAAQVIFLLVLEANQFRGIPLPALILCLVAGGVWVLTSHTTFGRYLYAIGGNEEAAVVSGVPVQRVTILAFALMGAIVAITGFLQTAYGGSSTTTVGDLMELDAVAACVIGGVSLKGGRGHVLGVLFGALIMAALINGMTLLTVQPEHKYMARGLVLILAVWMDVRLARS
jgi:D-xylose transport system permease protein